MKARNIVVGYDGSRDARWALEEAAEHVGDGGVVHVVTVHHPRSDEHHPVDARDLPEEFRYAIDPEEISRGHLRDAEQLLEERGIAHVGHLPWGHPAAEILDVADEVDADLIVLGSRGLGAVERFLRGSVSTRVANHARTSTLIIHREDAAA